MAANPPKTIPEEIMGTSISFKRPDGKDAAGYLAKSARGNAPGGVVFYGIPPEQAAKPSDIRIPLQAHFATKDDWCTPALVDGFEKAMKAAGKSLELFRYDAEHGFGNEQRQSVHDRQAAELAWERAMEFFKKHLG